jgi:hypothetical protein
VKSDRGWSTLFEDPIPLPRGRRLLTLEDAADFITQLPKAQQESPHWQATIEVLIMAAENRGPLLHARVGVLRALNRHVERVFNPDWEDRHRGGSWRGTGERRGLRPRRQAGRNTCWISEFPSRAMLARGPWPGHGTRLKAPSTQGGAVLHLEEGAGPLVRAAIRLL